MSGLWLARPNEAKEHENQNPVMEYDAAADGYDDEEEEEEEVFGKHLKTIL